MGHGFLRNAARWLILPLVILLVVVPLCVADALDGPGPAGSTADQGRTLQMSSRAPVDPLPDMPPTMSWIDCYQTGESVWMAVPAVVEGRQLAGLTARLCVVHHRPLDGWTEGARLEDVSGGVEKIVIREGEAHDNIHRVWSGTPVTGQYDLVVDFEPFGRFQPATDLLDNGGTTGIPGFRVIAPGAVDYLLVSPVSGCTRIFGVSTYPGGLPEGVELFVADGWSNGVNGIPENGGGDDEFLGPLDAEWSTDVSLAVGRIHPQTGLYIAGRITGSGEVTAAYSGADSGVADVMSTAPSWVD